MEVEGQVLVDSSAHAESKKSTKNSDVLISNLIKTLINFKKYKKMDLEKFKDYISNEFITIHKWRNKEEVDNVKRSAMHNFLKIISSLDWISLNISLYETEDFRDLLNRWHINKYDKEAPKNFSGVTCRVNNSHLFYGKEDILSVEGAYCAGPFNIEYSDEIYTYIIESWWNILQDTQLESIKIPKTKKSLYNIIFTIIQKTVSFLETSHNQAGLSRLIQIFSDNSEEYWLISPQEIVDFFKNKDAVLEKLTTMNYELQKVLIISLLSFEKHSNSQKIKTD
jgi:hypothetical protein